MDQSIIASFKSHYRRHFVQPGMLKAMEVGRDCNWTVLDAIYGVRDAWNKVTPATIKNCFNHCGFVAPDVDNDNDGMYVSAEDEAVYSNTVDDNLLSAFLMTVQDSAKEVMDNKAAKDIPEDEEEEVGEDPATPSTAHDPAHADGLQH